MTDTVVLLHGMGRGPLSMEPLAGMLRRLGFATLCIGYPSRDAGPARLAEHVRELLPLPDGDGRLHLLGHSLGGIVAHALLDAGAPRGFGSLVTLCTPHGGAAIADLLSRIPLYGSWFGASGGEVTTPARRAYEDAAGARGHPFGVIAAALLPGVVDHDGTVSVASNASRRMDAMTVVAGTHATVLLSSTVAGRAASFMRTGRFDGSPDPERRDGQAAGPR